MLRLLLASLFLAAASAGEMSAEDRDFMETFKNEPGVVEIEDGILMKIVEKGEPDGEQPKPESDVKTHFKGIFPDGKVFDSSHDRGDMMQVPVSQTLLGWQKVLPLMRLKDTAKACFEPQWAFGEEGAKGHIDPNKVVCYEIKLEEVIEGGKHHYVHPDHSEFAEAYQKFINEWAEKKGYGQQEL